MARMTPEEVTTLREAAMAYVADSGKWSGTSGGRCIVDYVRVVTFKEAPTPEAVSAVAKWLAEDNCPGWTGVVVRDRGGRTVFFETTHDSSD